MAASDLTTLANVLAWVPTANPTSAFESVAQRLISQLSTMMLDYLQRAPLYSRGFTDTFDGQGTPVEFLDQWPVTSVSSVTIDGIAILPAPILGTLTAPVAMFPSSGYRFTPWDGTLPGMPQTVSIIGGRYARGFQNCVISYAAGYLISGEAQTVPGTGPYTVAPVAPRGNWCFDNGVTYTNGTALVPVKASPTVGQYVAPAPQGASPVLVYTFNAADANAAILLSYSYIPGTLEDACINWVAERLAYRNRIGIRSQGLAQQEQFGYDLSAIPKYIQMQIQPYAKVMPV